MRTSLFLFLFFIPFFPLAQSDQLPRTSSVFALNHNYLIDHFTIEQGLSDNIVNAIIQDKQGYIWIGTNDGLNRFDGYSFTIFKHEQGNSASLSNNKVNAILEDSEGIFWVATDGGLNIFDPLTETFRSFQQHPTAKKTISHNEVKTIFEDKQGNMWFGTYDGLNKFDRTEQSFSTYFHQAKHLRPGGVKPMQEITKIGAAHQAHQLLVGYYGMGLMLFDKNTKGFQQVKGLNKADGWELSLRTEYLNKEADGTIWASINGRIFNYDKGGFLIQDYQKELAKIQADSEGIITTKSGHYLIPSLNGIYILNQEFKLIDHFIPEPFNPVSIKHNWVKTVLEDNAGGIWFGTLGKGVFHLSYKNNFINFSQQSNQPLGIHHNMITALAEVGEEQLWVGSKLNGIKGFNKRTYNFKPIPNNIQFPNGLKTNQISALTKDSKGNIWIGTWGDGINVFNPKEQTFKYVLHEWLNFATQLPSDMSFINNILETTTQEVWVGTLDGIYVLYPSDEIKHENFKRYASPLEQPDEINYINCISEMKNGAIWVGNNAGLHQFDPATQSFLSYTHQPAQSNSLSTNTVISIFQDSKEQMWVGTTNGLNQFIQETKSFVHYTEKDGLPDGIINGIQEDNKGHLWLATKTGISKFDLSTRKFKNYNAKDGLHNHSFLPNAFISDKNKKNFYAGGKNGLSIFRPDNIKQNQFVPPVIISSLKKYNTSKGETIETVISEIEHLEAIEFSYQDNIIIFELTALNMHNSSENQYAYQLEGFNNNWINIGKKREITFTNLDYGNYVLRVKGSNNDGVWNEKGATLKIKINPPWWHTWWAYLSYFLIILAIASLVYVSLKKRWALRKALQQEQQKANRLKELDNFKTRFYTNLTHEFRTPLTVILGMVEQIKMQPKKYLATGTQLIESNGKNLLRLINQLLDLSKLEDESFQLNLQQGDIIPYLHYLTESFQSYANGKNLTVQFYSEMETLVMDFDIEQIKQILTNLISNALKFTPSEGSIKVQVRKQALQLEIKVIDTGIGIASKERALIFDRFYQIDGTNTREGEGTGIGLAHTKELVHLMKGNIDLKSEIGKGSIFIVHLPIQNEAPLDHKIESITDFKTTENGNGILATPPKVVTFEELKPTNSQLPQLLIIEDNPDVVIYLKSCLSDFYQLEVAYNGKIGVEKALKNIPDLIISDVMMPEKDGFEVCDILKNEALTSHIPFILLTAKADVASRISGLKRGADAYLSKPFNKEELLVRLEALLKKQTQLQQYFTKPQGTIIENTAALDIETKAIIAIENEFLQKINVILEKHYADNTFSLPQLCQKIGMSRSQLFRKLKALVDTSPSAYIRSFRLNKAKILLEKGELNVSEVAWETGFVNLAHFSKVFQEEFGVSASSITG